MKIEWKYQENFAHRMLSSAFFLLSYLMKEVFAATKRAKVVGCESWLMAHINDISWYGSS